MNITIYRGTHEIGGTLIELQSGNTRILIDAGYPLFLNKQPIESKLSGYSSDKLLALGVLPNIKGLYAWDTPGFDAILISHAHIDHYGLIQYLNPDIPVYVSLGTHKIIDISILFRLTSSVTSQFVEFFMYQQFIIGDFRVMPFLMDHSAFDAAAFEVSSQGKTLIYTGDFRGHGRKQSCLDVFIRKAKKDADALIIEGTTLGRNSEEFLTEQELENQCVQMLSGFQGPVLFQQASQNIDRIVSFYKAAVRQNRLFVIDFYTAAILYELKQLGNGLPCPSADFPQIKVFFPYSLTKKVFNSIGGEYALRFAPYRISRKSLKKNQHRILMAVRPSMKTDIERIELQKGLFIYSLWGGYRESSYQKDFEASLANAGFVFDELHTSGHASLNDIKRVLTGLNPKQIIPIHTMEPDLFTSLSADSAVKNDGETFSI